MNPAPLNDRRPRWPRLIATALWLGASLSATASEPEAAATATNAASAVDSAASSSPVAPPRPAQSASLPSMKTPRCQAGASEAACCCAANPPLRLDLPPVRLPTGVVGKDYSRQLSAQGGQPPYKYRISGGDQPEGLALDEQGKLSGKPLVVKNYSFTVTVSDDQGRKGQQAYSLSVIAAQAAKPAAAASSPATATLKAVSPREAQAKVPAPRRPQVEVFKLDAATLKLLVPTPGPEEEEALKQAAAKQAEDERVNGVLIEAPATAAAAASAPAADAPPPAPGPLEKPQIEQLLQLLTPLLNVEYPTQQLFEAALDGQLCQFVAELTRVSAGKQGVKPPSSEEFARACPPTDWPRRLAEAQARRARVAADPAKALAAASLKPATPDISWQDLAPSIMPPELRAWLIERSGRKYLLSFDKKIAWDGKGCGCVQEEIGGQIYGFFPDWWSSGKPQKIDFSRLHRVSVFGLAFNDDGSLALPEHMEPGFNDFVQQARVHGTELDLTLYRNDWQFLKNADRNERDSMVERMIREVPGRALGVIDRRLDDWASRIIGVLPGLSRATRMGDGITLFLDKLPPRSDKAWRDQFDAFYKKLVEGLIATLRNGPNDYTLNLVISDRELATPGAFELDNLFDYLRQAEEPTLLRGRIHAETAEYKSNTNLTLRFIVTLSEPTGDSKKALRIKLDQSTAIRGGDRRIFLRKLIPMVSPRSKGGQQFGDDLIYYDDNYGGVAFWPLPIKEVSTPVDFDQNFDTAFLTGSVSDFKLAVRGWVCEHRWPLRAAFDLLLMVGAGCWLAMALNCAWRARWGRYMPLGALPPLAVGGLLFTFDPALKPLRESPFLLWTLLVVVTIWAVLAMRRTQVEKP